MPFSARARFVVVVSLTAFSLGGVLTAHAAAGTTPTGDYANDPRSGAALNRDAALNPQPQPGQLFAPQSPIGPTPVNNPAADATAQDTQSETTVTANGSKVVVGFNDSGSFLGGASKFTGWSSSSDGAATFTDRGALPTNGFGDAGDPSLAVNTSNGNIFLGTLPFNVTNAIPIFKSTDGGVTFGAPVNGIPGGVNLDKDWVTVDNFAGTGQGNVYVCASDFGFNPARIVVTRSTDGGLTFGPSGGVIVSGTAQSQGCYLAVGPDHSLYVAYFRGNSPNAIFVRRSTDGGITFGAEHLVATLATTSTNGGLALNGGARTNSFPHLAVNPANGDILAVYNDDNVSGATDNGNIFYVRSTDDGATWSAPKQVNDDGGRDQFMPTVAISPDGARAMFGYYSRSHDPANLAFHRRGRMATISGAGALTMKPSFQLSPDTPLAIGQDTVVNATYMGDYDVIAANNANFISTWADNRDPDSFHAHQPDVRWARVSQTGPVTSTDLSVHVTATPSTIGEGTSTTLKINTKAIGHSARDVYVSLTPPASGLKFTSVSNPSSCRLIAGIVGCSLGTINAGVTVTRNVTAAGTSSGSPKVIANATTTDNDSPQSNNQATATVTVTPGPGATKTFSSGNVAVAIPDNTPAGVDIPVTVAPDKAILDANASVRLDHTFDGDLDMFLVSPGAAQTIELSTDNGGAGDNYGTGVNGCSGTLTTFDDEAASSITAGAAPFSGAFKPEGLLSGLDGLSTAGTWNLHVVDDAAADTGTVGCVKLKLKYGP